MGTTHKILIYQSIAWSTRPSLVVSLDSNNGKVRTRSVLIETPAYRLLW